MYVWEGADGYLNMLHVIQSFYLEEQSEAVGCGECQLVLSQTLEWQRTCHLVSMHVLDLPCCVTDLQLKYNKLVNKKVNKVVVNAVSAAKAISSTKKFKNVLVFTASSKHTRLRVLVELHIKNVDANTHPPVTKQTWQKITKLRYKKWFLNMQTAIYFQTTRKM